MVKRKDIEQFFEEMETRKGRKLETGEGLPQYACTYNYVCTAVVSEIGCENS